MKGKIISWDDRKGFGFIQSAKYEKLFFHIKDFKSSDRPVENQIVTFKVENEERGKQKAVNVKLKSLNLSILFSLVFLSFLTLASILSYLPDWLYIYILSVSFVTFLAYWFDKYKAKKDMWRTPEQTLHLLSFFGGWPGALLAQQVFRHKTKKTSFKILLWLSVVIHLILWGVILYYQFKKEAV